MAGLEVRPISGPVGAVTCWDNRCVEHLAIKDSGPLRRYMCRVQIAGDKPA